MNLHQRVLWQLHRFQCTTLQEPTTVRMGRAEQVELDQITADLVKVSTVDIEGSREERFCGLLVRRESAETMLEVS